MIAQADLELKAQLLVVLEENQYQREILNWLISKAVQTYSKNQVCLSEQEVEDFILSKLKQKNAHEHDPTVLHRNPAALLPCSPQS